MCGFQETISEMVPLQLFLAWNNSQTLGPKACIAWPPTELGLDWA